MKAALIAFLVFVALSFPQVAAAKTTYHFEDKEHPTTFEISATVRGYHLSDQRVQWSGMESVLGAEAALRANVTREYPWGVTGIRSEFLIQQPFGKRNLALSDPHIKKYEPFFDVDTFEMSQLHLFISNNRTLAFTVGKIVTPFGRSEYPNLFHWRFDAPFIRSSEVILARETGILFSYTPGKFCFDVAVVNGEREKDTNSTKAIIARIGTGKGRDWEVGLSGKLHDGIGSEYDKTYNNHAGLDFKVRLHPRWILSGELIYDQYGYHQKKGEENSTISLYYREIYYNGEAITGIGGYLDLGYRHDPWDIHVNYGEYHPKKIGNPYHDDPNKRLLVKAVYRILPDIRLFATGMLENERYEEAWRKEQNPYGYLVGFQYDF